MEEQIKQVVVDGIVVPGYFVSNTGRVWTSLKHKKNAFGQFCGSYVSESKKEMTPTAKLNQDKTVASLYVKLNYPNGLFDYDYASDSSSKSSSRRKINVHQLVMNAFNPIMENPPERLKEHWFDLPFEVKKWISEAVLINHIDHDPTNNNLSNLEYVTPRENSRKAVEFYGGNVCNKTKVMPQLVTEKKVTVLQFV